MSTWRSNLSCAGRTAFRCSYVLSRSALDGTQPNDSAIFHCDTRARPRGKSLGERLFGLTALAVESCVRESFPSSWKVIM